MIEYSWYNPNDIPLHFYSHIFGIREICKEMKSASLYVTDSDKWLIAHDGDDIVGFCGIKNDKQGMWLVHDYVFQKYRGRDVHNRMIEIRLCEPHEIAFASCVEASRHAYQTHGFVRLVGIGKFNKGFYVFRENK